MSAPPVRLWRIATDTAAYQADDLSGRGAELTGGRWNRAGTPLVYASATRALACLETVVHLAPAAPLPLNRYLVEIELPAAVWEARVVFDAAAGVGWDAEPPGQLSLEWGTGWARAMSSLVAEVPSVVVPEECNYLVNPRHPDLSAIGARKVRRWTYDARIAPALSRARGSGSG